MSRRKGQQVVFPLASEDDFMKAIEDSSKYLTVRGPAALDRLKAARGASIDALRIYSRIPGGLLRLAVL